MARATMVSGSDFMMFLTGEAIALAKSLNITLTASTADVKTKDSGMWPDKEVTALDFSADHQSVMTAAPDEYEQSFEALTAALIAHQPVAVLFGVAGNADSVGGLPVAGWTAPSGTKYRLSGNALLTSVKVGAPVGDKATIDVSFEGVGPLAPLKTA